MSLDTLFCILLIAFPYNFTGFSMGNFILIIVGIIYLLYKREFVGHKNVLYISSVFFVLAAISVIWLGFQVESVIGLATYASILFFYLLWGAMLKREESRKKVTNVIAYSIGVIAIITVLAQGVILNIRIYGNMSYANTYALLLLIGIYINLIRIDAKFKNTLETIFIIGILFTGSRTTIIFTIIFIICVIFSSKEKVKINHVINTIIAIVLYIGLSSYAITTILIAPIALYILNLSYGKKTFNGRYITIIALIALGIFICIPNNTMDRLKNISMNNQSLQERFIVFEESIKFIKEKPLGHGINKYEYKVTPNVGDEYYVKYAHNSLIQVAYEIGVHGALLLALLFVYGLYVIYKKNKLSLGLVMYSMIFLHSLLDFDFSFVVILALWMLVLVLEG